MVKAYIFDMGGTLENTCHKPEFNQVCGERLIAYLAAHGVKIDMAPPEFTLAIESGVKEYRAWAMKDKRELDPFSAWSQYYLKGFDIDEALLRVIANNISNIWERNYYERSLRHDSKKLLEGLSERGFALGVISNTGCQSQVIEILHEYGIHKYFGAIYLSSLSGYRKPHTGLFLAAAADLGAAPDECVYVGDTVSRDVRGSKAAGYAACVRIESGLTRLSDAAYSVENEEADYVVENLSDILALDIAAPLKKATV